MKLLALVLLFSTFSSLSLTEVVNSFTSSCPSFFMLNPKDKTKRIVPTIFTGHQYKKICQRWSNGYRFATVYNTERRIPLYSAYTLLNTENTQRSDEWKIEPQLEDIKEYKDMKEMIVSPSDVVTVEKITHQAVNMDYKNRENYTRGHVFPRSFAADQAQADSTFTLTNIAPQTGDSNGEWESKVETPMKKLIPEKCRLDNNHKAYIVTGVVPGNQWLNITRGNKDIEKGINVPSYFWSAFCCTDKTDIKTLIGKGYIAKQEEFDLQQPSIDNLNKRLTELYGQEFRVFPGLDIKDIKTKTYLESIGSYIKSFFHFLHRSFSQVPDEL